MIYSRDTPFWLETLVYRSDRSNTNSACGFGFPDCQALILAVSSAVLSLLGSGGHISLQWIVFCVFDLCLPINVKLHIRSNGERGIRVVVVAGGPDDLSSRLTHIVAVFGNRIPLHL